MKKYHFIIYTLILSFLGCFDEDDSRYIPIHLTEGSEDLLHYACIWDKVPHAAFTDLVEYNNSYYCCFREGNNHISSNKFDYGKIRILKSEDGSSWTSVALITDNRYDLRDPKLSVTPDNHLMLLMGASSLEKNLEFSKTLVSFHSNTENSSQILFSPPVSLNIELDGYWLWRITWKDDSAYGVAYDCNPKEKGAPILITTKDGINYNIVTHLNTIGSSNEADIQFDNEKMVIVIRNNSNNGYLGFSPYPYTDWKWTQSNFLIHSPKIINIDDELFVTGRGYAGGNMLYHIKKDKLKPIYIFPGKGDSGYPGAILTNNELWISYYSTDNNRTSIYFAKILNSKLLVRTEISK